MKKTSSIFLTCLFFGAVLFLFSSCGVSNKRIIRYQKLEEDTDKKNNSITYNNNLL